MIEAIAADSQPAETPVEVPVTADAVQEPEKPAPEPDPNVTANGERLDRQTRNWRALERDRDYWREMAVRQPQAPPPAAPEPDTAKTLADFQYDEGKYQAYLFQSAETRAVAAARKELQEQSQKDAFQRRVQTFQKRETDYAKNQPDYYEVTRDQSVAISTPMLEAIAESEDGPALAYHLGKNPDVASRIAELSPLAAARELGRIEARLANERETAKKAVVSKAPPPAPKIEGVEPAVKVSPDDPASDKMSADAWFKARNKQVNKRA